MPQQQGIPVSNSIPQSIGGSPLVGPYVTMPGYYSQYSPAHVLKPGDNGHFYPPYLAAVPQALQLQPSSHGGSEGDHNGYMHPPLFPAFLPFPSTPVYPYVVPRHDGQTTPNYMVFSMYPKSVGGPGDLGQVGDGQVVGNHDEMADKSQ